MEVKGGQSTKQTAAQLGKSVKENAGTGGSGGGSFVYTTADVLLLAAGGGGGASGRYNGVDVQADSSGTRSVGKESSRVRNGGTNGQPGECNREGGHYHGGGVGAGWFGRGCTRLGFSHGERGGTRAEGWIGGKVGGLNSGINGALYRSSWGKGVALQELMGHQLEVLGTLGEAVVLMNTKPEAEEARIAVGKTVQV